MTTLDQEVSDAVTGQLMLKVDAEGHDAEVLAGAGELISQYRPVILVEVWDGGRSIRNVLSGHGYRSYKYDPRHRRLFQVPPGPRRQGNLLFIADATLDRGHSTGAGGRAGPFEGTGNPLAAATNDRARWGSAPPISPACGISSTPQVSHGGFEARH